MLTITSNSPLLPSSQYVGVSCLSTYVLELVIDGHYYPLLQELSYIRPLRMLSPNMFVGGAANDWVTQNSCPTAWENATLGDVTVTCAGILGIAGTGRWKYEGSELNAAGNITLQANFKVRP